MLGYIMIINLQIYNTNRVFIPGLLRFENSVNL